MTIPGLLTVYDKLVEPAPVELARHNPGWSVGLGGFAVDGSGILCPINSFRNIARIEAAPFPPDQFAEVRVTALPIGPAYLGIGPLVRGWGNSWYEFLHALGAFRIASMYGNTGQSLSGDIPRILELGDLLRLEVRGGKLVAIINGKEVWRGENYDIGAGYPGISMEAPGRLADFSAGFLSAEEDIIVLMYDGQFWTPQVLILPLRVSTVAVPDGQVGVYYEYQLEARGGVPPYTWDDSQASFGLPFPPGISLDYSTGILSGTPTQAGSFEFGLAVTDSVGTNTALVDAVVFVSMEVESPQIWAEPIGFAVSSGAPLVGLPPWCVTLPSPGTGYGSPFPAGERVPISASRRSFIFYTLNNFQVFASAIAFQGTPRLSYFMSTGAGAGNRLVLEEGLAAPGKYRIWMGIQAGSTGDRVVRVIDGASRVILTIPLWLGNPGWVYDSEGNTTTLSDWLSASTYGGVPVDIDLQDGSNSLGGPRLSIEMQVLSGNNSVQFSYFAIQYLEPPPPPLTIVTDSFPDAIVGVYYEYQVQVKGGEPPYTFTDPLEFGFSLSAFGLSLSSTGLLSGTPTQVALSPGIWIPLEVTDAAGTVAEPEEGLWSITLTIDPALSITTASLPDAPRSALYSFTVQAAGGIPSATPTWSLINPPPGLVIDSATGEITGRPRSLPGTVNVEVAVSAGGANASRVLPLNVLPAVPWAQPVGFIISSSAVSAGTIPADCVNIFASASFASVLQTVASQGNALGYGFLGTGTTTQANVSGSGNVRISGRTTATGRTIDLVLPDPGKYRFWFGNLSSGNTTWSSSVPMTISDSTGVIATQSFPASQGNNSVIDASGVVRSNVAAWITAGAYGGQYVEFDTTDMTETNVGGQIFNGPRVTISFPGGLRAGYFAVQYVAPPVQGWSEPYGLILSQSAVANIPDYCVNWANSPVFTVGGGAGGGLNIGQQSGFSAVAQLTNSLGRMLRWQANRQPAANFNFTITTVSSPVDPRLSASLRTGGGAFYAGFVIASGLTEPGRYEIYIGSTQVGSIGVTANTVMEIRDANGVLRTINMPAQNGALNGRAVDAQGNNTTIAAWAAASAYGGVPIIVDSTDTSSATGGPVFRFLITNDNFFSYIAIRYAGPTPGS